MTAPTLPRFSAVREAIARLFPDLTHGVVTVKLNGGRVADVRVEVSLTDDEAGTGPPTTRAPKPR